MEPMFRPRRLRRTPGIRRLVRETRLSSDALVLPLYIKDGSGVCEEIGSLPGQYRYSPDTLPGAVEAAREAGVKSFLLFGIPGEKDESGSGAWDENGVVQQGLRGIKSRFPDTVCIADVCLCEYTSHGHCGILREGAVENDPTLELLARTAAAQAAAGADIVAPSDMMDGRVAAIRAGLDAQGFEQVPVMSYAVKYASAFYGPFREAAGSAPSFGDRRGYQMDYHNRREARKEARLDIAEGADMLIVKPAMSYLDILADVRGLTDLPLAGYSVSGEYAMVKAAARNGWLNEYETMCESAAGVFRAGADILITHYAKELAAAIQKGDMG